MKEKLEEFWKAHTLEAERYKSIVTKCQINLGIISLLLGLMFFKGASNITICTSLCASKVFFILGMVSLFVSLIAIIYSLSVRSYEAPYDVEKYVISQGNTEQQASVFFEDRLIDIAFSWKTNYKKNNQAGIGLTLSTISLGVGLFLLGSTVLTQTIAGVPLSEDRENPKAEQQQQEPKVEQQQQESSDSSMSDETITTGGEALGDSESYGERLRKKYEARKTQVVGTLQADAPEE